MKENGRNRGTSYALRPVESESGEGLDCIQVRQGD
jgi:hypothetical protein